MRALCTPLVSYTVINGQWEDEEAEDKVQEEVVRGILEWLRRRLVSVPAEASGGSDASSRSLPHIFVHIHCQAFPKHCLNYISKEFGVCHKGFRGLSANHRHSAINANPTKVCWRDEGKGRDGNGDVTRSPKKQH
ncbi:unnamed protein product [Pleuronectes platessa]|uniref:Uncharacterized protein n=1 Tax=Pleuronectes platessa TaxID=8262 RepID=A0A9N7YFS6_PLEPL|nr:unnamed protein product [Pleuronectes platessa]